MCVDAWSGVFTSIGAALLGGFGFSIAALFSWSLMLFGADWMKKVWKELGDDGWHGFIFVSVFLVLFVLVFWGVFLHYSGEHIAHLVCGM